MRLTTCLPGNSVLFNHESSRHVTALMNSSSATSLASASGARQISTAMLPPPPRPSYTVIFPSSLFPAPLRTPTGLPHPKSLPNTSNRGEPEITTTPAFCRLATVTNLGVSGHAGSMRLTLASSPADATARFSSHAAQPSPLPRSSPAVARATAPTTVLPMRRRVGVGDGEAAGQRVEAGQRASERRDKVFDDVLTSAGRLGQDDALLDVVAGDHPEIQRREVVHRLMLRQLAGTEMAMGAGELLDPTGTVMGRSRRSDYPPLLQCLGYHSFGMHLVGSAQLAMDKVIGILRGAAGLAADANAFWEFFSWVTPHVLAAVCSQQQQQQLVDSAGIGSASAGERRTATLHQIQDDLQKLEHNLWVIQTTIAPTMHDLIDRLEWHSHKETEAGHLRQIKDVVYDAEDLLDEYNYYALKVKVKASKNLGQDHLHEPFLEFLDNVNFGGKFSKVMEIQERLKHVFDQSNSLGLHKTPKKFDKIVRPETCRVLEEPDEIFGREKELEDSKQKLRVRGHKRGRPVACSTTAEARRTELLVLPIVGMGGVGKTTMAQQICEDGVVRNHFNNCIIWICVSDEFEVNRLTRDVLKSLGVKLQDSDTRDTLMVNLRDSVKSKKFLLVLDDMWDDVLKDEKGWRTFHRTLSNGLEGSMILVTTRSSKVANLVSNSDPYELKGLQDDVFWDFFKLCAFKSNGSRNDPEMEHIRPELERIGRAILPKLKGSPLAAKTLGRLLKSNLHIEHWEDILRRIVDIGTRGD
uniref:NB-ARC domain-containing protein n=1 Tax=Oryza nivara TaxID=4536 RepID=A0A0E0IJ49_ORYNI